MEWLFRKKNLLYMQLRLYLKKELSIWLKWVGQVSFESFKKKIGGGFGKCMCIPVSKFCET